MQEHEYKARDKTVQKMSRDGLREENLRNKEEKRITGRDMDTEVSRSEKKDELDFSKRRREHINEKMETEHSEQSSKKTRYSREPVLDEESEQDIDGELDGEQVADESTAATKSAFRSESIRGQPRRTDLSKGVCACRMQETSETSVDQLDGRCRHSERFSDNEK